MEFNYNIEGGNFSRAGTASSEVKKILKQLNVNPAVLKRIVVALYEAEVNVVAHAYEGTMQVSIDPTVITVVISDRGPGIPDIDLAGRIFHRLPRSPGNGIRSRNGSPKYAEKL